MKAQFVVAVIYLILALFAILSYFILRNIFKYVIKMKKYKEFRIAAFYVLAVTIVALRVSNNILLLWMKYGNKGEDPNWDFDHWVLSYTCRQFENILGMQQLASMVDLCLMVEYQGKLRLQKTRKARWPGIYEDKFDEQKYRRYASRVAYGTRVTGFLLSGALIGGIIVVSVDNKGLRYWGVPRWIRWIDCVINTMISLALVILMMSMYRIYGKFL